MGRTRGSGEGSIYKNGKTWRGQIILGGKRKSVTGKTRREVADKLAEIKTDNRHGKYTEPTDITVAEWVEHWLIIKKEPKLVDRSYKLLYHQMHCHIIPYLGKYKLHELNRTIIEEAFIDSFEPGKYTVTTPAIHLQNLRAAMNYAIECNIITKNPCKGVELRKYKDPKKISAYTPEDQNLIISSCKYGTMYERFYYFLLCTGMRFAEAAALTWSDVNLKTGRIVIDKITTIIDSTAAIQHKTKTSAGMRTIFVGENIISWLNWHYNSVENKDNPRNLVFQNTQHTPLFHSCCAKRWSKKCAELGIEYQGMHALRHTWATRALESEIDVKTVSKMLGHSDVMITMEIYQDVLDHQKIKAACTLNAQY